MKITATCFVVLFAFLMGCEAENNCEKSDRCELDPEPGPCKALFHKYYFDREEGKCKEFIWGGCNGVVPFETLEECKQCECTSSK